GTLQGSLTVASVNGVANFTNLAHNVATTITIDFSSSGLVSATSDNVVVSPATFTKLQLLVPSETAAPATPSGKSGSPTARTAGSPFNVTVNAVDDFWNVVNTNDTVAIASSDSNATLGTPASLLAGTQTFSVTLKTAGSATVSASDTTNPSISADTS